MIKLAKSFNKVRSLQTLAAKAGSRASKCIVLCLVGYLLSEGSSLADCPVANPRDQPIFWAFQEYVAQNYRPLPGVQRNGMREFELAYGHALGRLSLAVNNDPERKAAFECVGMGIDQQGHLHFGALGNSVWIGVSEAARGMDDYAVNLAFGVTDISPLEIVFAIAERMAGREPPPPAGSGGYTDAPGGGYADSGPAVPGGSGGAAPAPNELPVVSSDFLNGYATPTRTCASDTPAAGQSIGTAFGTLGPWKYKYAYNGSDEYTKGGGVLNLCDRGVIEVYSGGTTYLGHYDGTEFSGIWYGNPSCSMSYSGYRCDNAPYGNTCWGEIAWRILDYVPEAYSGKKLGQVAFGYWNYCGKQGTQGKGKNWWYGKYFLYAIQQVTK